MGPPCVIFATTVSTGGGVIGDEVTCLPPPPSRQNLSSVLVMTFPSPILHFQDAKGAPTMGGILEPKQQLLPGGRQVSARDSCSRSPPQTHSKCSEGPGAWSCSGYHSTSLHYWDSLAPWGHFTASALTRLELGPSSSSSCFPWKLPSGSLFPVGTLVQSSTFPGSLWRHRL